jgi:hypothetical protein
MCFFGFWYRVTVFSVGLVETSVVGRVGVSSSSAPLGSVCFSLFYAHTLHSRGLDAPLTIRPRGGGDSQKAKIGYSYQVQPLIKQPRRTRVGVRAPHFPSIPHKKRGITVTVFT